MGLQSHLNDVSSDSIPLLLIATISSLVTAFRSFLSSFLRLSHHHAMDEPSLFGNIGAGLANLAILAEQLQKNTDSSYAYSGGGGGGDESSDSDPDCVVCLCRLRDGELVRRFECCRHVFHMECVARWLDQFNFSCPLCRSPLVSAEVVADRQRSVSDDFVAWFAVQ